MDIYFLAAVVVMLIGVVGTIAPGLPGGLLVVAGFYLYWWSTGFSDPGTLFAVLFTLTGLFVVVTDYLAGMVAAKAGGATNLTAVVAGIVGLALLLTTGPLGALVGVVVSVMALEVIEGADAEEGLKAGLVTAVGMLGSGVVQVILTLSMTLAFIAVVLL